MSLLLYLLLAVTAGFTIRYIIISVRQASKAKSLGCQPAPLFRPWDILGIENFKIEISGMKANRLADAFLSRKREMSAKVGRDCKTFRIYYPPGETWYYTFDPKNLQAVLATQFNDFQQPAVRVGAFQRLLGLGIFSANGPIWERSRALLRPQFMQEQIADLELFETHVKDLFDALPKSSELNGWTATFDMQPLLERFTMDTATEFLFGESVHSLKDDDADASTLFSKREMMQFVEAFFAAEKTTAMSMFYGDLYWLKHDRKFKEQCKVVHDFVDKYIERRWKQRGSNKKSSSEKYVVLDAIVADVKDRLDLRSQLLQILLAGSDTISGTLGFLFASLAQHPEILKKLRSIIVDDFGTLHRPKLITLSGLRNCTYLQWCLNEVLRVYPVVPVNFKEAVRDTTLPTGGGLDGLSPVFIPKGHLVAWEVRLCVMLSNTRTSAFLSTDKSSHSYGRCTQIPNSGAPMPPNSFQSGGLGESSASTTFPSMLVHGYALDNSLRLLRLLMSPSGFCRSSTTSTGRLFQKDDYRAIGSWLIK